MKILLKIKNFFSLKTKVKLGDIVIPECLTWTDEQIRLIEDIPNNYNVNVGIITISKDYSIIDGNHRFCILLENYGNDHEIFVKKIPISVRVFYLIVIMLLPILLPIGIFLKLKQTIFKNKNG